VIQPKPLTRKKYNPKDFIYTGHVANEQVKLQLYIYNADHIEVISDLNIADLPELENKNYNYWLNIHGLHDVDKVVNVCNKYDINDLIIQDILDVNQRPKHLESENLTFLTIKSVSPSEQSFLTEQISFVFTENLVISFQERKADFFKHLRSRLVENKGLVRQKKADFLIYLMLESLLDNYFNVLDDIQSQIDKINLINLKAESEHGNLVFIEEQKKKVNFIKKAIFPIKEFSIRAETNGLVHVSSGKIKYFQEIKDLCLTLIDNCDMILSILESQTNLFFASQGYRMNQVMKTLTIVSTIFIPLTFLAGIYGMNFKNMPELKWQNGYFMVLILCLIIAFLMIVYFKRKKWF
jgi:magnesium transporter